MNLDQTIPNPDSINQSIYPNTVDPDRDGDPIAINVSIIVSITPPSREGGTPDVVFRCHYGSTERQEIFVFQGMNVNWVLDSQDPNYNASNTSIAISNGENVFGQNAPDRWNWNDRSLPVIQAAPNFCRFTVNDENGNPIADPMLRVTQP